MQITATRTFRLGATTYTSGQSYTVADAVGHMLIKRGWASGTAVGSSGVAMLQDWLEGTTRYSNGQSYTITNPLGDFLIQAGLANATVVDQPPTAISLSSTSVMDNAAVGTVVGAISVTDSDGFSGSLSLTSNPGGYFGISGSNLVTAAALPAGASTQNITIQASESGGSKSQAFAITVQDHTALVTIGTFSLTDTTGAAQTNMPFELGFPLPLDPTKALAPTDKIVLLDGTTTIATQEDNRTTDKNGKIRWLKIGGILPSLGAGQTKTITVAKQTGTPNTTPVISIASILATDYEETVEATFLDGTVYTAKATDALQGATTWNKNAAQYRGKFRSGAAHVEHICSAPLKTSGGTVHPHLRAQFHIAAQADGKIRTDIMMENGWCGVASPSDQAYGLKIYRGKGSPTVVENWPTETIDAQISGLSTGLGGQTTVTLTGGTWRFDATKDVGRLILNTTGAGHATVLQVNSPTQAVVITPQWTGGGFASATMAANTCAAVGVNHWHGAKYKRRDWWNGNGETYVFAWPAFWAQDCQMVPNFRRPANQITYNNINTDIGGLGNRPCRRANGPATSLVPHFFGQVGGYPTIAVVHDMYRKYILDPSTNSRKYLESIRNVAYSVTLNFRDENTGNIPSILDRWDFSTDTRWGTCVQYPATASNGNKITDAPWSIDDAHHGSFYYVPYLAYGEFQDLESLGMTVMWMTGATITATYGRNANQADPLQTTNLFFNETMIVQQSMQLRGMAWSTRNFVQCTGVWPDAFDGSVLRHNRSHYNTWVANWWSRYKNNTVDDATSPGTGKHWGSECRPIFYQYNGSVDHSYDWPQWQQNFLMMSLNHGRELGLGDANLTAILQWFDPHVLNQSNKDGAEIWWAWMLSGEDGAFWPCMIDPASPDPGISTVYTPSPPTWASVWAHTKNTGSQNIGTMRMSVRVDLSATSGTAAAPITATIKKIDGSTGPGLFANGGSWYVGGYIHTTASSTNSPTGQGKIVAVIDANTVQIVTDAINCSAFTTTSTTYSGNSGSGPQVWLPIPHPTDIALYKPYYSVAGANPYYGPAVSRASIVYAKDRGVAGADAALTHINSEMNWIAGQAWPYATDSASSEQFQIDPR